AALTNGIRAVQPGTVAARRRSMSITRRHALGRSIAAVALVLVAGCGSSARTSVTQVWKAPVGIAPMKSIVVFAAHLDEANRRTLEDAYVTELAKHDVAAKQSYT
ncbi:hypothetical protein HWN77_28115, partial [Escherichia coli]|uniref:hypothetical protein n=1 Tax=Escherichia coli TaxID=562 RepID=UPI00159B9E7B